MYLRYEAQYLTFSRAVGKRDGAGQVCQFSGVVTTGETKVQKQSFMENFLLRQKEGIRICWMLL
jgi:hypothetical protein